MIEEDRPCLERAQQLQAVENAIDNAKKALIHDHIAHCADRSMKMGGSKRKAALAEFRAIKIPLTAAAPPEVEVNKNAQRAPLIQGDLNLFRIYGIDHFFVSKVYNRILHTSITWMPVFQG